VVALGIVYFLVGIARGAEYKFHVITETGTYRVYKAPWEELQQEHDERFPQHRGLIVSGFSDFGAKEIWYAEDGLQRALAKIPVFKRLWKHPLEAELERVSSYGNLVRGLIQKNNDVRSINRAPMSNRNRDLGIR
jgi:hypothetical protein